MRHAVINKKTNKVTNVIIWDGNQWTPPKDHFVIKSDVCECGDLWEPENKRFIKTVKKH